MHQTEIRIRYPSTSFAKAVKDALSPDDNAAGDVVRISSRAKGRILSIHVEGVERIETLQSTLQDIFRCIHAAETSLTKVTNRS